MKYLLDSNTLIEAKNRYYNMNFCPAYWQWIRIQHEALEVSSISLVGDELKHGHDELADWAKDNPDLFLDVSDEATQNAFSQIAEYLSGQASAMKEGALEEFLSGADPWLIAKAMACDAIVVTHEKYNPDIKRKFLIPNVCEYFNVSWIDTFELLQKLEAKFILPA